MSRDERGSASVLVVTVAGVLVLVALALSAVAGMIGAHRRAQSAADLAALAAADALSRGGDGCVVAGAVAQANGAALASCRVEGADVWVEVRVRGPDWRGAGRDHVARARAGP
ncbi:Rv3654c family TadE-like protein [Nocardioides sp. LHG3406-4]|uniref:Rv3654c family TadE-like protein n=1 Tax=Nocardioides sp. LHG3406-4 TaxID=2804575 RepID=UPI003CE9C7FC